MALLGSFSKSAQFWLESSNVNMTGLGKKNEKCSIRKISTELSNYSCDYLKSQKCFCQIDECDKLLILQKKNEKWL